MPTTTKMTKDELLGALHKEQAKVIEIEGRLTVQHGSIAKLDAEIQALKIKNENQKVTIQTMTKERGETQEALRQKDEVIQMHEEACNKAQALAERYEHELADKKVNLLASDAVNELVSFNHDTHIVLVMPQTKPDTKRQASWKWIVIDKEGAGYVHGVHYGSEDDAISVGCTNANHQVERAKIKTTALWRVPVRISSMEIWSGTVEVKAPSKAEAVERASKGDYDELHWDKSIDNDGSVINLDEDRLDDVEFVAGVALPPESEKAAPIPEGRINPVLTVEGLLKEIAHVDRVAFEIPNSDFSIPVDTAELAKRIDFHTEKETDPAPLAISETIEMEGETTLYLCGLDD